MKYSIALATTTESWRVVKRAEELGFDSAWFYDTQLLNPDLFIGMALAAHETSRIGLGTGVLIPSNRLSTVAANGLATLNRIAPGRIRFGVGSGFTGRRTMGLRAMKLKEVEIYIEEVLGLLRGETITSKVEGYERLVRFLNPDFGLINIKDPIPLYFAGSGPRSRRLTAKLNAGWVHWESQVDAAVAAVDEMRVSWRAAGHQVSDLSVSIFALGCVLRRGESFDSPRAIAQAGPKITVDFHALAEEKTRPPGGFGDIVEEYIEKVYNTCPAQGRYLDNHRGHLMVVRDEEKPFITADLIERLTFTGTNDALASRLRTLEAGGVSEFVIQLVNGHETAIEEWAEVFSRV
jgi:5,10-methylenetetrahydromethanopterin reductase